MKKDMKRYSSLLAAVLVCLSCAAPLPVRAQATAADSLLAMFGEVAGYEQRWTREQVYVHLDNNAYMEGETIWFSAYVVYASTLRPTRLSRVLYVELLNAAGDVMERKKLRITDEGQASGEFKLEEHVMRSGFYEIRAYTRAMLNWDAAAVFSRVVPVFRKSDDGAPGGDLVMEDSYGTTDAPSSRPKSAASSKSEKPQRDGGVLAEFFPEGGSRVEGLPSVVAFRLTDTKGNPIDGTCSLYDKAGGLLATASTEHEGMGSLTVPAGVDDGRVEVVRDGKTSRFSLPDSRPGYALSVAWASDDTLRLTIGAGAMPGSRLMGISVTARGHATYFDTLSVSSDVVRQLSVLRTSLGNGVNQVSLVDASGRVWAERLVWNNPPEALRLDIRQNEASYAPCSPVALEMTLTDMAGRPRQAIFSLSVRDRGGEMVARSTGIRESLLLSSGVKGYIARPEYYFASDDEAHRRAIDLLLLVQGWRCYDWQEMAGLTDKQLIHPVEEGILIDGRAVGSRKSRGLSDCQVDIDVFLADQRLKGVSHTDSLGGFAFLCPSFFGDGIANFYISREGKARYGFIALNRNFSPQPRYISEAERTLRPPLAVAGEQVSDASLFAWTDTLPEPSVALGEARVVAKGFNDHYTGRFSWRGGEAAGRRYSDVYYNVEEELERYMDEGKASPLLWEWLKERNHYFSYELLDDGGPTSVQEAALAETGLPALPSFKVEYKGRPTYVVLDNDLLAADRAGFLEQVDPAELMADEVKSLIISEDPVAYQRFVLPRVGGTLSQVSSPVVIFVYTNPQTNIYQYKKGRRITRIHGYASPAAFDHPDYRQRDVPTDTDYRRTLYWNSRVSTDAEGKASAVFFSNSRDGSGLVFSAQGVTAAGEFIDLER